MTNDEMIQRVELALSANFLHEDELARDAWDDQTITCTSAPGHDSTPRVRLMRWDGTAMRDRRRCARVRGGATIMTADGTDHLVNLDATPPVPEANRMYEIHVRVTTVMRVVVWSPTKEKAEAWAKTVAAPHGLMNEMAPEYDWANVESWEVE